MFALIRNIIIIFLLLSIAYAILSFTARIKHRVNLEAEYKTQSELRQMSEEKDVFIARGMKRYARSYNCLLYTSPSPRDQRGSRMPSSA